MLHRLFSRAVRVNLAVLVFFGVMLGGVAQAELPNGIVAGASVEGVHEYTLPNGLKLLLFPDATQPKTTVNITYLVGSRHENYGETGMAHLLEHMLFKGTPTRGNLMTELSRRGMSFNGTTSFDRTNYFETFPVSEESLDWALAMEADRMVNSRIAKSDLDSEMTVVRNEMESGENDPLRILWQRTVAAAYDWHHYANFPIGARSDVENVDITRLQAFYRTYYQPDNAVLVIAGAFDVDKTLALVARYFGPIARPARTLPRLYTQEPVQDGQREVVLRRVGNNQWIAVAYHTVAAADPDAVPLEALSEAMIVTPAGRLYKSLVEAHKATTVDSWVPEMHDPGLLMFFVQVPEADSLDTALSTTLTTLESAGTQPISSEEMERVRTKALKSSEDTLNDPQRFGVAISEWVAAGDWRLFFIHRDRWRKVTPADVQRVAGLYIKPSNRTVGEFIPDSKPDRAPASAPVDVASLVKDYKGDTAVAAGESFDPTPANLEARTERLVLPNGMKVALLPKKTRGETVQFMLSLHYADEKSSFGKEAVGSLTVDMLPRGTTKHTRQQIEDRLDQLKATFGVQGGVTSAVAGGRTDRAHLADTLRLMAEVMRSPSFPASELEPLKREVLASVDERRNDPGDVASRALGRYENPYPKGDVRYEPTVDEEMKDLAAVSVDDIKRFYSGVIGAGKSELAIVGDFDPQQIKPLLTELFGDWKSPAPYVRVPEPLIPKQPTEIVLQTPDKANAVLAGEVSLPVTDTSPDAAALQIANYLLGGSSNSKLWERIRQTEGLSYGLSTSLDASSFEPNTPLAMEVIFAPQNLQRLKTALADELQRVLREGFSDQDVAAAKQAVLAQRRLARTQDRTIAAALARQGYLGRTFAFSAKVDADIAAVSTDAVNAALRKYVKPEAFAYTYAGDFAKQAAAQPAAKRSAQPAASAAAQPPSATVVR